MHLNFATLFGLLISFIVSNFSGHFGMSSSAQCVEILIIIINHPHSLTIGTLTTKTLLWWRERESFNLFQPKCTQIKLVLCI